jgi:hypothetical protein
MVGYLAGSIPGRYAPFNLLDSRALVGIIVMKGA